MSPKKALQLWFATALLVLLWVTVYATYDGFSGQIKNVLIGYKEVWSIPWGMATLFDAYFAFIAFWIWVAYKESSSLARILWLAFILGFGNFAISIYMLIELKRLKSGEGIDVLLTRKN